MNDTEQLAARAAEVAALATHLGAPVRQWHTLAISDAFWQAWGSRWPQPWHEEVLFLLPRPGGLLLHRKARYPTDAWRLLTGGIQPGEGIAAALQREIAEEVGLRLAPRRFVGLLRSTLEGPQQHFACTTYLFLMAPSSEPLHPSHDGEVAATRTVPLAELPAVAARLAAQPAPWAEWGRFRALAHRLAASHVRVEELS